MLWLEALRSLNGAVIDEFIFFDFFSWTSGNVTMCIQDLS